MHMTELASPFLTATLSLASGAALATETNTQPNNGQANFSAGAGQIAPDARENVAPDNVDNSNANLDDTVLHPNGSSINHKGMTKDEMHKNTMYKDGRCPDVDKKVGTGDSTNNDAEIKTDDTIR